MTEIDPYKMMKDAKSMLTTTIDILNCIAKSDKVNDEVRDKSNRIASALEIDVDEIKRLKKIIKKRNSDED